MNIIHSLKFALDKFKKENTQYSQYIDFLLDKLNENANLEELAVLVKFIEQTTINISSFLQVHKKTMKGLLKAKGYSLLDQSTSLDIPVNNIPINHQLVDLLVNIHRQLLEIYQTRRAILPVQCYTLARIQESNFLNWEKHEIADTEARRQSLLDVGRGIVIGDTNLLSKDSESHKMEAINKFTNNDLGKTNAILSIHQAKYAEFADEFMSEFVIADDKEFVISASDGSVHWQKSIKGEIYADIYVKSYTILDVKDQQLYTINPETKRLMKVLDVHGFEKTHDVMVIDEKIHEYKIIDRKTKKEEIVKDIRYLPLPEKYFPIAILEGKIELKKIDEILKPVLSEYKMTLNSPDIHLKTGRNFSYTSDRLKEAQVLNEFRNYAVSNLFVNSLNANEVSSILRLPADIPMGGTLLNKIGAVEMFTGETSTLGVEGEKNKSSNLTDFILAFGGSTLIDTITDEVVSTLSIEGNDVSKFLGRTGQVLWQKDERGRIFADVQTEVYALEDAETKKLFVLDPKTNQLQEADEAILNNLNRNNFQAMKPIFRGQATVVLKKEKEVIVPVFERFDVNFKTKQVMSKHELLTQAKEINQSIYANVKK